MKISKTDGIRQHCHADDTDIYLALKLCNKRDDIFSWVEACFADISILDEQQHAEVEHG